jgi:hypothetical protein
MIWRTDRGTPNKNGRVMFRLSTDGGKTSGNKTNLSNTPNVDSIMHRYLQQGIWWANILNNNNT